MATVLNGPVFLFALEREAAPCRARGVCPILVTGVGRLNATAALRQLLDMHQPTMVVCAGFAGAIRDGLHVGDVVVAGRVIDGANGREEFGKGSAAVLTMDRLIGDPAEKRSLGTKFGADVVDMESAAVARTCAERGIPWAVVRVVSDEVDKRLSPKLLTLLTGGTVSIPAVLRALVGQPGLIKELLQLQRSTRLAADRLAAALAEWPGESALGADGDR